MNSKLLNLRYQYFATIIGALCLVFGIVDNETILIATGLIILIGTIGTIFHIKFGKHTAASKLPKDFEAK